MSSTTSPCNSIIDIDIDTDIDIKTKTKTKTKTANSILSFSLKNKSLYIDTSKIAEAGQGLYAKKIIHAGQPVAVYYGQKITDKEVFSTYQTDPEAYRKMNTVIRSTPNGYAILGEKSNNPNLLGVYVNDISSIKCSKEDLTREDLVEYAATAKKCNLKTVDTSDYPVYVATKRIKKGEELYVHYGIGYWLLHNGSTPEDLTVINQIYKFETLYS